MRSVSAIPDFSSPTSGFRLQIPNGAMKFSHPALSITVAAEVAALQDVDVEKVLKQVRKNTAQMYGINPSLS